MNRCVTALLALVSCTAPALAQESTNVPAATTPGEGGFYLREKFSVMKMSGTRPIFRGNKDVYTLSTTLTYGVTRDLALSLEVPLANYDPSIEHKRFTEVGAGLLDMPLTVKYRLVKYDIGPLSSASLAVWGGVEIPSGADGFSSNSYDPYVGAAVTVVAGRHGFNQAVSYKFQGDADWFFYAKRAGDGDADALRFDTSYLYRVWPDEFTSERNAGTYLQLELNGLYETNGDIELMLGGGILYEAPRYAIEATVAVPVHGYVRQRQETDVVFTVGFRYLF
jgi:hypothetical protein